MDNKVPYVKISVCAANALNTFVLQYMNYNSLFLLGKNILYNILPFIVSMERVQLSYKC